jgi:2'-5' RNA ligase
VERGSGLILPLDRLEALIGDWRRGKTPLSAVQVPAHVTLAHPLPAVADLGDAVERLRALFAAQKPFELRLEGYARFPAARVLYLEPQPTQPLHRLADASFAAVPGAAPDFDPHVFHATLAQGVEDLDMAEVEMRAYWGRDLPLVERIDRAQLYEMRGGVWRPSHVFPFAATSPTAGGFARR